MTRCALKTTKPPPAPQGCGGDDTATPVGGLYAYTIRAFHDSAYDLPEDFFERVEGGLDAETRTHLMIGFHSAKRVTQIRSRGWLALVAGIVLVMIAGPTAFAFPSAFIYVAILGAACVGAALVLYAYAYGLYLAHREGILSFLSFVRAAQRSSLGRDLA